MTWLSKKIWLLFFLLLCVPDWTWAATTWYVRPDNDGNGTDLNYGAEDGTSWANAFDGFADISGIAAGDTVCLPGGDEPFMHEAFPQLLVDGTAANWTTYKGCGATPALLWNVTELTGSRSFDTGPAIVNNAPWVNDGNGVYHKPMGVMAFFLWENETYLQPVNIIAMTPTQIAATLQPGQWGNRSTGPTFELYYRPTSPTNSPSNTKIRCDYKILPSNWISGVSNYTVVQNMEIRGTGYFPAFIKGSHVRFEDVTITRCKYGIWVYPHLVPIVDVTFTNVRVLYAGLNGMTIQTGPEGITDLTFIGGEYSDVAHTWFNGDGFQTGDGDGIGIGISGASLTNLVMRNVTANRNYNYGVFVGTSGQLVTNITMTGMTFLDNNSGCFGEGTADNIRGTVLLSGFICSGNKGGPGGSPIMVAVQAPAVSRTFIICNGVLANNVSIASVYIASHTNNKYLFCNLVFHNNSGTTDIQQVYPTAPVGNEVFKNVYFNSFPNTHKAFAVFNNVNYYYDVGQDIALFNTATGSVNNTYNVNPRFVASTDFHTSANSLLRNTGLVTGACADARGRGCRPDQSDIGAYQTSSGDQAGLPDKEVTLVSTGTATANTSGSPHTVTGITIGQGSNTALVVCALIQTASAPTGVTMTWNGSENLSLVSSKADFVNPWTYTRQIWVLTNPTAGNKNLVLSWTGGNIAASIGAAFANVHQTTPVIDADTVGDSSTGTTVTTTVPSAPRDATMACSENSGGSPVSQTPMNLVRGTFGSFGLDATIAANPAPSPTRTFDTHTHILGNWQWVSIGAHIKAVDQAANPARSPRS